MRNAIKNATFDQPLDETIHRKTLELLRIFLIIGGMPEVVATYVEKKDLYQCQFVLDDLMIALRSDFAKYKRRIPTLQISTVFDSVVKQAGKKFVYSRAGQDYSHYQIKQALEMLIMAGLELLKSSSCYVPQTLYYWQREQKNSYAEVDYVIQRGEKIVPIEVKSGASGKMQSLHLFMNEKKSEFGVRTSLENIAQYDKIRVYPLYAIENLVHS